MKKYIWLSVIVAIMVGFLGGYDVGTKKIYTCVDLPPGHYIALGPAVRVKGMKGPNALMYVQRLDNSRIFAYKCTWPAASFVIERDGLFKSKLGQAIPFAASPFTH